MSQIIPVGAAGPPRFIAGSGQQAPLLHDNAATAHTETRAAALSVRAMSG
jgi:hypothetical protein